MPRTTITERSTLFRAALAAGRRASSRALGVRCAIGLSVVAAGLVGVFHADQAVSAEAPLAEKAPLAPASVSTAVEREALEAFGTLQLAFVPNAGQADSRVRYSARGGGYGFSFTAKEAVLAFMDKEQGLALALRFLGAKGEPEGARPLRGQVNYLIGNDPAKWRTGLPTYGKVVYRDLWPGIDLAFSGRGGTLKYELQLAPRADVRDIRLAYRGADRLSLRGNGGLRIHTPLGLLTDTRPASYQQIGGERVPIESRFVLRGGGRYGFALGAYDARRPLVIDPGLVYSTYLGGSGQDDGRGIAVDSAGSAYVTGFTQSSNFPTTPGAFDTTFNGGFGDGFVTKLNPSGSALDYSTYLGGSDDDQGFDVAVDGAGSAHVTGLTQSSDFPTNPGAFDTTFNGVTDAFVTKLGPTGSSLVYSTYLGGPNGPSAGFGIALDAFGSAYVTGRTLSGNFPTTAGAFDTSFNGSFDAFVTKLGPTGSSLVYSTYLGGSGPDRGNGIVVDASGSSYVTGQTSSANFPTTSGTFDTSFNGGANDAFVTKLNAAGSAPLIYSTYLGGSDDDQGFGIAVDGGDSADVTGFTFSSNFPTTVAAFDTTLDGTFDAFVTKLNTFGTRLVYSTYLGGSSEDRGAGIALDGTGSAYVTGFTASSDFPTTPGAFDTSFNGGGDAFVTKLNAAGSGLVYSTYLGVSGFELGRGIAVDGAGNAYVTGLTRSSDFPTTPGAFDTTFNGGVQDAFVTKLAVGGAPATVVLTPAVATNPVGTSHTVTATVSDAGGSPVAGVVVRFSVTGSVSATGQCTTDSNGQCSFTYQGPALPGADLISAFADTDNDGMRDAGEPAGAASKTWVLPVSTPGCEVTIADGGRITALNGDKATFGGHALVSASGQEVSGQQEYQDHGPAQPLTVHSTSVLAVVCSPDRTEATIFGEATIDGSGSVDYRIRVKDLGEPGTSDVYGILLSSGYASGDQTLEAGNVQIQVHEA